MEKTKYVVLSIIDAPKTCEHGGPKEIIARAVPLLGAQPRFGSADAPFPLVGY